MTTIMKHKIGFVMEQTLGHVTHDRNLRERVALDPTVDPRWMEVPYDGADRWARAPIIKNNWTLRASLRARDQVRRTLTGDRPESLFFHTQVTALFAHRIMASVPTVVSLDATPKNVDSVGAAYNHVPSGSRQVEALKNALTRRTFRAASHMVTWCDWAKQSLISDYGVPQGKITVIPPGIDLGRMTANRGSAPKGGRIRLLFVGGDFKRKGGDLLLDAYRNHFSHLCDLDIVTKDDVDVDGLSGVRIHRGLMANSTEILSLYASADIFVFPTLGDCLPIAVMEAMASGLPVVSTCVGAIDEEVENGVNGFLVAPGDSESLRAAVSRLVDDADLRAAMGDSARRIAGQRFDGASNYQRLIDLCKGMAHG